MITRTSGGPALLLAFVLPWVPVVAFGAGDLDIKGRLMIDYSTFDGVHNEGSQGAQWYIRRARIGLDHDSERGWQAELEVDYDPSSGEIDIKDAMIEFALNNDLALMVGQFKENFSLENTTSSNDLHTLERSVATEAFSPGRNFGAALEGDYSDWYWQVGLFQAAINDKERAQNALTGRSALRLFKTDNGLVHLGVSLSHRDMGGEDYEINEPIAVAKGDKIIESRDYAAETINTMALEGAWVYKRFSVQTEYFAQEIKPVARTIGKDPVFDGFYIATSFFLTGHRRHYKNGSFEGFEPVADERGVELVARYSQIDLRDQQQGVKAHSYQVALNYYLSEDVTLLIEASASDVDSPDPDENGDGNAITARAIYKF